MSKVKFYLFMIVSLLIVAVSGINIALILQKIGNYYKANVLIVYVVVCILSVVLLSFIWKNFYGVIEAIEPKLFAILIISAGVVMFFVCSQWIDDSVKGFTDYTILHYSANVYANNETLEPFYINYFLDYSNNLKPMLMLSLLFKAADYVHIPRNTFVLAIVCIQVVATAISMGILVRTKEYKVWRLPAGLILVLFTPLWGFTSAFYTDTMSMGLCVIALALIRVGGENSKLLHFFFSIIAGVFITLAIFWKITAIIPIIAYILAKFLTEDNYFVLDIMPALICVIALFFLCNYGFNKYDICQQAKQTGDPVISWFALGMKNDGTWNENRDFVNKLHEFDTTQEKKKFTMEYIKENQDSLFGKEHLVSKAGRNFANGNLAVDIFLPGNSNNLFSKMFDPQGSLYKPVTMINLTILFLVYLSILVSSIWDVIDTCRGNCVDKTDFSIHISLVGIFIFLMLWEASSRQLYNQIPMLLLSIIFLMKRISTLGKN